MKRHISKFIAVTLFLFAAAFCPASLFAAPPTEQGIHNGVLNHWEESKNALMNYKAIATKPDFEIFSAPFVIMMKVNRDVEVRLFTILGKLISEQELTPGIFEYHMDAHGVYIIKTGDFSCKIAI